jgi:hypothetical protein
MRVLIIHHNPPDVGRLLEAARRCWGVVSAETPPDLAQALICLSDPNGWPDIVLASVRVLEQPNDAARTLVLHPGRCFFRLVAVGQTSDELSRARVQALGDAVVAEAVVTNQGLLRALQQAADLA